MEIRNLKNTSHEALVESLLISFADYFVMMPEDLEYWRQRFKAARVNFELSFGVFEADRLVAFIINGIDWHQNELTAFNSGTGVVPDYRGRHLVDKIYEYALPFLRDHGIQKCLLEVIQKNKKAIRVYERIGFQTIRSLKCFKGELKTNSEAVILQKIDFQNIEISQQASHSFYSWDNVNEAIKISAETYDTYEVLLQNRKRIGYFTIKLQSGYLAQFEAIDEHIPALFSGIQQLAKTIRINNVDATRKTLIRRLEDQALINTIDQFEMEMKI